MHKKIIYSISKSNSSRHQIQSRINYKTFPAQHLGPENTPTNTTPSSSFNRKKADFFPDRSRPCGRYIPARLGGKTPRLLYARLRDSRAPQFKDTRTRAGARLRGRRARTRDIFLCLLDEVTKLIGGKRSPRASQVRAAFFVEERGSLRARGWVGR